MLGFLQNRKKEDGFTLIELMVVVLIIAILVAIAVPTFLGARGSSQDRSTQSDLRNALSAAKVYYADNEVYAADVTALGNIEAGLDFVTTAPVVGEVRVQINAGADQILFTGLSSTDDYWGIMDDVSLTGAGTTYCGGSTTEPTLTTCTGTSW